MRISPHGTVGSAKCVFTLTTALALAMVMVGCQTPISTFSGEPGPGSKSQAGVSVSSSADSLGTATAPGAYSSSSGASSSKGAAPDSSKNGDDTASAARVYKLALKDQQPGTRDRRFRVKVEGNQIVSYPSRQEIESGGRIQAKPIAWVESKEALYALHVQGSGRILLPN